MGIFCVYLEHPTTGETRTLAHEDADTEDQAIQAVRRTIDPVNLVFQDGVKGVIYAEQQA